MRFGLYLTQVYGDDEWSFGFCEQGTGVFSCPAGKNPMYTYRECIVLGTTNHSIFKVNQILRELSREWPGHSYDLLAKNCNHFCDEFCERLGVQKLPGNLFLPSLCFPVPVDLCLCYKHFSLQTLSGELEFCANVRPLLLVSGEVLKLLCICYFIIFN